MLKKNNTSQQSFKNMVEKVMGELFLTKCVTDLPLRSYEAVLSRINKRSRHLLLFISLPVSL